MKVVMATNNPKKKKELSAILSSLSFEVLSLSDIDLNVDPEETGDTFEENAMIKAKTVCDLCNIITVADDSGLEVDALSGAPGVHTSRFAGDNATDAQNIDKLLSLMENEQNRKARFVSSIACVFPDGRHFCVRGTCSGEITKEPTGEGGFGYDPVFFIKNYNKTFAQLPSEIKNNISHRGNSLRLFAQEFKKYINK